MVFNMNILDGFVCYLIDKKKVDELLIRINTIKYC